LLGNSGVVEGVGYGSGFRREQDADGATRQAL
jgi:hypothetical protein